MNYFLDVLGQVGFEGEELITLRTLVRHALEQWLVGVHSHEVSRKMKLPNNHIIYRYSLRHYTFILLYL